jgi:hypothetical protein
MADNDSPLFSERRHQRHHVADVVEDAVRIDIERVRWFGRSPAYQARRHGNPQAQAPRFDAATNRTIPAIHGKAPPADLRPVPAERSRWRKWCAGTASPFRLVSEILLRICTTR